MTTPPSRSRTSARARRDRQIIELTISSSTPVRSDELLAICASTVAVCADRRARALLVEHRAVTNDGSRRDSNPSSGGGRRPGAAFGATTASTGGRSFAGGALPSSVSAANTLNPAMAQGFAHRSEGRNDHRDRCRAPASGRWGRSGRQRRRAARALRRAVRRRLLEPRIQTGTYWPLPGMRTHMVVGVHAPRSSPAAPARRAGSRRGRRCNVRRSANRGRAGRCRAHGRGRGRCVRRKSASRVPNCSAMTSGAWFGSMMPPASDPDSGGPGRRCVQSPPRSRHWRCPACCDAPPPSSGGTRAPRNVGARRSSRVACMESAGFPPSVTGERCEDGQVGHGSPGALPGCAGRGVPIPYNHLDASLDSHVAARGYSAMRLPTCRMSPSPSCSDRARAAPPTRAATSTSRLISDGAGGRERTRSAPSFHGSKRWWAAAR